MYTQQQNKGCHVLTLLQQTIDFDSLLRLWLKSVQVLFLGPMTLFPKPIDLDKHHERQDGGLYTDPLDPHGS